MSTLDLRGLVGLSETKARERLAAEGPNELPAQKRRSLLQITLEVVREPMFLMLVAAGALYLVMGEPSDAGLLLGSVVIVMLPPQRQSRYLFVSLIGLALLLVAFASSTSLWLSIAIMALIGVAQSIYLATNNTLVQLAVPDALQGRVMSVYMTTWGLMPLGALPQGILADWFGAPLVLGGVGLLSASIVALMLVRNPALRRL